MKRSLMLCLAVACLFVWSAPAVSAQEMPTNYTFVAEWAVPRQNWADWRANFDRYSKPVFERHAASGNLIGWGAFESIVHTEDGITHGTFWTAPSFAALNAVLNDLLKATPASAFPATKHRDYLLTSVAGQSKASPLTTGFIYVSSYLLQPGKGGAWMELWNKYNKPGFADDFAKGNLLAYSIDVEDVHTADPGLRFVVSISPNAEADDRSVTTQDAANAKRSAEERRAIGAAFADTIVPGSHRDFYARLIAYWRK
ncbi:MAG TPA: hypothetical protein VGA40_05515 [Candidatus Acidoferrales bacterium]